MGVDLNDSPARFSVVGPLNSASFNVSWLYGQFFSQRIGVNRKQNENDEKVTVGVADCQLDSILDWTFRCRCEARRNSSGSSSN
jgi:hypothetical protein